MALLAPKRTLIIGGALAAVLVLYALGSEQKRNESSEQPAANPTQCRVTVTAEGLRVREAPSLDAKIVGRFSLGNETNADKVVQNGFRKLGDNRWVSTEFVKPVAGRDCG